MCGKQNCISSVFESRERHCFVSSWKIQGEYFSFSPGKISVFLEGVLWVRCWRNWLLEMLGETLGMAAFLKDSRGYSEERSILQTKAWDPGRIWHCWEQKLKKLGGEPKLGVHGGATFLQQQWAQMSLRQHTWVPSKVTQDPPKVVKRLSGKVELQVLIISALT